MDLSKLEAAGDFDRQQVKTGAAPAPVPSSLWRSWRGGLRLVHYVTAAVAKRDREAESAALAAVAGAEVFAPFGPAGPPLDRGRWLVERVVSGVDRAQETVPRTVPGGLRHAAEQAIVLWNLHVSLGIGLADLGDAQDGAIDPPIQGHDLRQKIRGRMWLTAKPTARAADGIAVVFREVQAALRAGTPTGGEPPADESARVFFAYEWRRLEMVGESEDRDLLTLLSVLAPEPVPPTLLSEAWGPLPAPLRQVVGHPARISTVIDRLADRGLVTASEGGVALPPAIHPLPAAQLTPARRRRWLDVAVRFLRAALPPDTHYHEAWLVWSAAAPHVEHVAGLAQVHRVRLAEVADLLDRLSVYYRSREYGDPRAVEMAERAVALVEEVGVPDRLRYGTYLGNLALAHHALDDLPAAIAAMERSLDATLAAVGVEHLEYAESLNNYGSMLGAAGRMVDADRAFEEALAVIRRIEQGSDPEEVAYVLREILNDYASHLLRRHGPERGDAATLARRALDLLHEAAAVGDPDGYGVEQIMLNRADALRRLGEHAAARDTLVDLVCRVESAALPEPSLLHVAALADLADVLEHLGDPSYVTVRQRAHEVDDALAGGRSSGLGHVNA